MGWDNPESAPGRVSALWGFRRGTVGNRAVRGTTKGTVLTCLRGVPGATRAFSGLVAHGGLKHHFARHRPPERELRGKDGPRPTAKYRGPSAVTGGSASEATGGAAPHANDAAPNGRC